MERQHHDHNQNRCKKSLSHFSNLPLSPIKKIGKFSADPLN
ncbi:Uncharacterized protein dnm_051050 [Desulfonema magnum]|uniref:Uncharacterized protein n=1 Tax=Desulfonema magnum TaxID=45655 RepID=A0A975BPI2_9BACT|nr:Uncharacterized protein dnm_051050 [Desulfonema magnum]